MNCIENLLFCFKEIADISGEPKVGGREGGSGKGRRKEEGGGEKEGRTGEEK